MRGKSHGRRSWWGAVHGVTKSRTWLSDFTFTHWRKKWQPTPVFLPGEFHGQRSLAGYSPCGRKESDTTNTCPPGLWLPCWTICNYNPPPPIGSPSWKWIGSLHAQDLPWLPWATEHMVNPSAYFTFEPLSAPLGEGNGNPPQYFCLENPMDGGAS